MPSEGFSKEEIERKLKHSLGLLLGNDYSLLENDVNERSISHRLALYLQQEFDSWHVDCEYNRDKDEKKTLGENGVYPDIVIHHRGTDHNLVAIEMKKTASRDSGEEDRKKLKGYKEQLGYKYAVFIKLKTGCEDCIGYCLEFIETSN